ncbi:unnamed protein product [Spirodela intermedia]|uniref:F-box domain-containing protein n=1 Tax=Spirodela intermedia TaxID=51605 RepID=A0A7I8JDB5_SPIIN|nr:unnamed protein product [Spirodela intermedia]CAA6668099.1 unnamed protein product [Spirodela intermedia]
MIHHHHHLPPPTPPPTPSTPIYEDVADLLPADPFGMGMTADPTTWTVAIAGWIEELATTMADHVGYGESGDVHCSVIDNCDYYMCNQAVAASAAWLCPVPGCELGARSGCTESGVMRQPLVNSYCGEECVQGIIHDGEMEGLKFSREEEEPTVGCGSGKCRSSGWGDVHSGTGAPHDGLTFALAYLDIPDLLSVERVCKTLHYTVREDPLLWRCIHIGPPLNNMITDDSLLRLTWRAKGSLECLSLTECSQITDSCLSRILKDNLKLRKDPQAPGGPGIRHLAVGGLYNIKREHYDELKTLLCLDGRPQLGARKPRFYHLRRSATCSGADGPTIDIEACPVCENIRVIYDCPLADCRRGPSGRCRACSICISRCNQCGRCIHGHEYEETFFLEWICFPCMNYLPSSSPASEG